MQSNQSTLVREKKPIMRLKEARRLEALHSYQIMDTPPESSFDDLVRLASIICGTPMALVSLLDNERQWSKARVGVAGPLSFPRELTFCHHTIEQDALYEVEDATPCSSKMSW